MVNSTRGRISASDDSGQFSLGKGEKDFRVGWVPCEEQLDVPGCVLREVAAFQKRRMVALVVLC